MGSEKSEDDGLKPDRESVTETVSKVDASRSREKKSAEVRKEQTSKGDKSRRR